MRACVQRARGGRPTYCFIELHLLLQVQADDAVVVVDAVAVEVIHLSYNKNQGISQFPWPSTGPRACSAALPRLASGQGQSLTFHFAKRLQISSASLRATYFPAEG